MQLNSNHRFTRLSLLISLLVFGSMHILYTPASTAAEEEDKSPITHLPIPVAPQGQAFPILAGVKDSAGRVQSMIVKIKGTDVKAANLTMISLGKENQYEAVIPAESMSAAALFYSIELVAVNGTFSTPWYPIKTASIEDKAQKTVENQTEPVSKTAKAKAWVKAHPYIAAGATVGTVAVGAAVAGGGGGGGGDAGTADTSALQGSVSGSWSGVVMGVINASGNFSITITDHGTISGSYSGTQSGSISGTITSAGALTASGSAGNAVWNGQVNGQSGSLTASGTWTGYDGGGTWNGSGG